MFNPERTNHREQIRTAKMADDVSFAETIEHLGGVAAIAGGVLLLLLVYLALVEWFLPRRRLQTTAKQQRLRATAAKRR